MGDIYLLVQESHLSKIHSLLYPLGFVSKVDLTRNRWHDSLRGLQQIPFGKMPGGRQSLEIHGVDLDFHWNPAYRIGGNAIGLDVKKAWATAHKVQPSKGISSLYLLSDPDLSWHLLTHTASFGGNSYLVQLLDLGALMAHWSHETSSEIHNRILGMPEASQKIMPLLMKDTRILLGDTPIDSLTSDESLCHLLDFFLDRKECGLYRRTRRTSSTSIKPWSLPQKALYALGYFLPNPEYYSIRLGKQGFDMYKTHWTDLVKKLWR